MLSKERKNEIIKEFQIKEGDTGSPEVQIAVFSEQIKALTDHLKVHKKDHSSRRGLYMLIGQRKGLLNYLQKTDIKRYRSLIKKLNIRG